MGTQQSSSLGYGIRLSNKIIDKIVDNETIFDIEQYLDENYPLLSEDAAGDHWDGEGSTVVVLKESLIDSDGITIFEPKKLEDLSVDALAQLNDFVTAHKIKLTPSWMLWFYRG